MVYPGGIRSVDFITLLDTTAGVYGVFVFMMPAILLSGYVSPVETCQYGCKT